MMNELDQDDVEDKGAPNPQVVTDHQQKPEAPLPDVAPRSKEKWKILGAKIAGGILLANAGFTMLQAVLDNSMGTGGSITKSPIGTMIDIGLGVVLLGAKEPVPGAPPPRRGVDQYRTWVALRAVLGCLLQVAAVKSSGAYWEAVAGVAYCLSLLGLVLGSPSRLRIILSTAGAALLFGFAGLGLAGGAGYGPTAGLESLPADNTVHGVRAGYRITAAWPWRLRTAESMAKLNPLVDRWVTRADVDAHVIILSEVAPVGDSFVAPKYVENVLDNIKNAQKSSSLLAREPLTTSFEHAELVRMRAESASGLALNYWIGVYVNEDRAFQVIGFVPVSAPSEVNAQVEAMVRSFVLDEAAHRTPL
jgi:hypothetical protein